MRWMRNQLIKFLKSCHILELINSNFKFVNGDSSSGKIAIENSLQPEILQREMHNEITPSLIKYLSRKTNI